MLTDSTAELFGLDSAAVPDDVFKLLPTQIGDTLTTARNDLGSNWLLCNGDLVSKEQYPELWDVLSKSQEAEGIGATYQEINDTVSSKSNQYCNGIAYGNGYWVICVSHDGREDLSVYYSTDKVSWTYKLISSGRQNSSAYRIRFVNGYFVICAGISGGATILYTKDPSSNWSYTDHPLSKYFVDIAYADGVFVIASKNYTNNGFSICYSTDITADPNNWVTVPVDNGSYANPHSVYFVNGYWVVCGATTNNDGEICYTQDYRGTWTKKNLSNNSNGVQGVLYSNGQYIVYGMYSNAISIWFGDSLDTLKIKSIQSGSITDSYFYDGVSYAGITLLVASPDGLSSGSSSKVFYLYNAVTPESEVPFIDVDNISAYYIANNSNEYIIGCGDQYNPIAAIEVWDKKLMQKLPTITNDLTYTYIKARKGS